MTITLIVALIVILAAVAYLLYRATVYIARMDDVVKGGGG